ncbi:LOW QUALITY PROTEIN: matrix metalloproteinase-2 [Drosophila ficusphila]|uniref:LOW QUALITY PROTEIN: matrix metalloproteinase-2 n=1 Tax=Drosophila ficusphila TaxID=30025 RepID=UPI0007E829EF|nr:LOW QUALITY PROTEIN: matrix metalloproteinase-2 [Drosophila ficusphila]
MCSTRVASVLLALVAQTFCLQDLFLPQRSFPPTSEQLDMQAIKPGKTKNAVSEDVMYNYLMQFDYLPKSDLETGALRTEQQLKDAVRSLQSFGNIPVTGQIDAATARLIQRPRCGVGDKPSAYSFSPDNLDHDGGSGGRVRRYVLQGPKWSKKDLTWSLVNQTMPDAPKVRMMVSRALSVWESNSKLTFREVYSDQADIQIVFARLQHGDGYKFDGPGQVLAHAFYPGEGRGGDAHFDADENWNFDADSDDSRGTSFLNVALHELGHSLGLGHSSDENAVMFPWYQSMEVDGKLPDDDRNGIQELYGAREKTWGPYWPRNTPPTTSTTTTTMRTMSYYPEKPVNRPQYNPNRDRERARERQEQERRRLEQERQEQEDRRRERERERQWDRERQERERQQRERERLEWERANRERWRDREQVTQPRPTSTTPRATTRPHATGGHRQSHHHNKPRKPKPDTCNTYYDAISMIRGELFIFRGPYLWRIGASGLYPGYPTETRRHWAALPVNLTKVDAVYENKQRQIVFFIGSQYFVFNSVTLAPGFPKPLASLGLPPTLTHIDASFVWGHNNRTYLTSGTLYWRIDDYTGQVELDYPRDMSIWSGVGYNIDAAFQYVDGKTYFFKNLGYWEFNDDRMKVAHARVKLSSRKWMQCARNANEVDDEQRWTASLVSGETEGSEGEGTGRSGARTNGISLLLLLLLAIVQLASTVRRS